ncbi:DUF6615 family protein [Ancylobacter sp. SL191]|uniref:DUF6615 family protein n=1 Tax=Ancylobacter sp. SL191 TaxID=2995166 RepID=UPI003B639B23
MLCQFAHQFPYFVESFLEQGRSLRRRFREETVTDVMMGSLITAGGGRVVVEFPNEPVTGADMEWNFVNTSDGTFFRILLQAKQAYGEGKSWMRHGYKELLHTSGTGPNLQAETLCDTARAPGSATYPLYILYHPAQTCALVQKYGSTLLSGVNLADGFVIEKLVKAANTRALRTRNKSLKAIAPHLFSLTDLFCPPTVCPVGPVAFAPGMFPIPMYVSTATGRPVLGVPIPPTPRDIRDRIANRRKGDLAWTSEMQDTTVPEVPRVSETIPDDVKAIIARRVDGAVGAPEPLNRWRMTFITTIPRDVPGAPSAES